MLPAAHRLHAKKDLATVFRKRRVQADGSFVIFYCPNHRLQSRFAVVVGKKAAALATARNRVRRQVREILRQNLVSLSAGYDMIVHVKAPALPLPYSKMAVQLQRLCQRAGLIVKTGNHDKAHP